MFWKFKNPLQSFENSDKTVLLTNSYSLRNIVLINSLTHTNRKQNHALQNKIPIGVGENFLILCQPGRMQDHNQKNLDVSVLRGSSH